MIVRRLSHRCLIGAMTLAGFGLIACSQDAAREQPAVPQVEHAVPGDNVLANVPDLDVPSENGRSTQVTTSGVVAGARVWPDRPRTENRPAGSMYAASTPDVGADAPTHTEWPMSRNRVTGPMYASAAGLTGDLLADPASVEAIAPDGAVAWSLTLGTFELESLGLDARAEIFGRSMDNPDAPLLMAAAADDKGAQKPTSAECSAFKLDIDADLGEVLRAGCQPTLAQMSALMDNPLGNVAMLFTQFDFTRLKNPSTGKTADKYNYMGIAQFPKRLNKDWNLINRVVWNVPSMPLDQDKLDAAKIRVSNVGDSFTVPPGSPALIDLFGGRTTGFGDIYYVALFSPTEPIKLDGGGKFVWGAGFDLGFPTASEDILGTGRWTAGPSALGVYLGRKWKIGALATHYWDFAGEDDRDDVNLTNLQYFVFYSLDETTSIGAAPNIIANWEQNEDNILTLPVGIGISKTFKFGKVPVRFGAEIHYSIIQPDDVAGSEWNFRFYVIPAVPSALFSWMQ